MLVAVVNDVIMIKRTSHKVFPVFDFKGSCGTKTEFSCVKIVFPPRFDKDKSGNIDAHELQQALVSFGYSL